MLQDSCIQYLHCVIITGQRKVISPQSSARIQKCNSDYQIENE